IRQPLRNIRPPRSLPHVTRRPIQPPRHRLRRNPRRTLSMLPCSTNWRCPWRPIPHRPPNPRPVRSLWMTRWPSCWASFPSIKGRKRGQNPRQKKRPETRPQCHLPTSDLPSIVSVTLLAALMALLRLDRKCSDRPCIKPLERNRLAGFLAIAICSFIKALQRRIDLGDQLALAIPRSQFDSTS